MTTEEAIRRLSNALSLLSDQGFDKEAVRTLTCDLLDEKHQMLVEKGFQEKERSLIIHGILGMLSHYEDQKEKERKTLVPTQPSHFHP